MPRGNGIFELIGERLLARAQGRIYVVSSGYVWGPEDAINASGYSLPAIPAKDGRMAHLKFGMMAACNCPQPPGDFPIFSQGAWVPMKDCRKCEHHRRRQRGQPYPCCAVLRNKAKAGPSPARQMADMVLDAVSKAKRALK